MYLWAPFIVQNLKNIFRANLEFRGCVIFGSEMTHLLWTNLFWYKPLLLPSSTYWHFLMCKIFKTILTAAPESWGHTIFESKMVPLPQTIFCWKKLWTLFSYTYWPLLLWKIFKKILTADPELWGCTIFWAINGLFATMRIFFRKPVNNPCSFHSCLSTCQISKSDDDLLKKYWWLKNTEISLAKRHFRL